jgi:hypothetical protein
MRRWLALALILCVPPTGAVAGSDPVLLHYEAYSHGLPVMRVAAALRLTPSGYGLRVDYHTVGIARLFYSGQESDSVSGAWGEAGPEPRWFLATGTWRGRHRETEVEYHGSTPALAVAVPPITSERQPVPANLLRGTIDTLSAMVRLLRAAEATDRCSMEVRTYDGRRLSRIAATTTEKVILGKTSRSVFAGPASRCAFTGQMLAGFLLGHPADEPARPYQGAAWLARIVPDEPPLPVRLSFQTKWVGTVTMYLTGVQMQPAAGAQATAFDPHQ